MVYLLCQFPSMWKCLASTCHTVEMAVSTDDTETKLPEVQSLCDAMQVCNLPHHSDPHNQGLFLFQISLVEPECGKKNLLLNGHCQT